MRRLLPALAAALAVGFAWITPLGESPDELGHIRYAETLASGRLPVVVAAGGEHYEAHQPPLGYLLPALVLAASGGIELAPTSNPRFDFYQAGERYYQPPFAAPRDQRILRLARMTQALWAALTVWAGLGLARDGHAAAPYLLAPQLLFVCGAINNDAALIACVSCALLFLIRFAETGEHAVAAGVLASTALFIKASALFLIVPIVVAAVAVPSNRLSSMRRASPRYTLLGVVAAGLMAGAGFNLIRFGSVLSPIPTASRVATVWELVGQPQWLGGLFRSSWAKFGWLNTPMPWPFYLWFALVTAAAVFGVLRLRGATRSVLASAVLANFGLVLAYLLTIDKQPQGRYLLPSLVAITTFGSASPLSTLKPALLPASIFVALAALATIAIAFY